MQEVMWRHVLRNALLPTIAVVATQTGYLLGGLVIVERAFNYPGLGQEIVNHAVLKDYSVVQAGAMVIGAVYLTATVLADIAYGLLNPAHPLRRLRLSATDRHTRGRPGQALHQHAPRDAQAPPALADVRHRRRDHPLLDVLRHLRLPHRAARPDLPDQRHPAETEFAPIRSARISSAATCSRARSRAAAASCSSLRRDRMLAVTLGTAIGLHARLLPRLVRRDHEPPDRRLPGDSGDHLPDRRDRQPRHVDADADPHDRPGIHADHRAHGAGRRPGRGRAGLRAGRQAARRACALHPLRGDPAEHPAADHRRGYGAPRLCDLRVDGHHLPRARPAAARPRLGRRHHRRAIPNLNDTLPRRVLLDHALPGHRDHLALRCGRDAGR